MKSNEEIMSLITNYYNQKKKWNFKISIILRILVYFKNEKQTNYGYLTYLFIDLYKFTNSI